MALRIHNWLVAAALGAILCSPAGADTKAGVDAWTRGDFSAAVREWTAEAARGDADALYNLGQAYRLGQGAPMDLARAESLYGRAAQLGHPQAADNYGLLLFQRGEQKAALPYLQAAAARGEPRAQYLLGVAHFNGTLAPKDWVRAYALVSLARAQGIAPAADALKQMDGFIPLDQRQKAVTLGAAIDAEAAATRNRQFAAADLQVGSTLPAAGSAPATAATAGADYARPIARQTIAPPPPKPAAAIAVTPQPKPAAPATVSASGPWRIQLGAFSVAANADALWNQVRGRPALAGHPRILAKAGAVTRLQVGGFASQAAAKSACAALASASPGCIPVQN